MQTMHGRLAPLTQVRKTDNIVARRRYEGYPVQAAMYSAKLSRSTVFGNTAKHRLSCVCRMLRCR